MSQISTLIIGHRGASAIAPENTLASVKLAWEMKADAVEVDLRLTKDRKVVAIHDATTGRTTGLDRAVASLKLEDLQRLDAGAWKSPDWRGEKIPSLREILKSVPAGRRMVLELKEGIESFEPLADDLEESGLSREQVELITFDYELACEAKRRMPDVRILWLFGDYKGAQGSHWSKLKSELIRKTCDGNLDGIDLGIKRVEIEFYEQIKSAGLLLYLWTVNDLELGGRLLRSRMIDAITTDLPDEFLKLRRSLQ